MYSMNFLVIVLNKFSESGYPGFQDVQDEFSVFIADYILL